MTENEKMLNGQWYDANFDEELLQKRLETERLCWAYTQCKPGSDQQVQILQDLLKQDLPEGLSILAPVYFDYGNHTKFGSDVFVNHGCYFMDGASITIGSHVFIGPNTGFYTAAHPLQYTLRNAGLEKALPISVGDNCWIGANVSILPGVQIGNGCVIAAGSVVNTNLPDNAMAAGVPAEVKKHIEQ